MTRAGGTWRRRVRLAALLAALLLVVYVGSYAVLYDRGDAEARRYGYDFFFYVPFADVGVARETTRQHQLLGPIYHPLNDVHRHWFGGRAACRCILFELNRAPER